MLARRKKHGGIPTDEGRHPRIKLIGSHMVPIGMTVLPPWLKIIDRDGYVTRALSDVIDRTEPDGSRWCPPRVASALIDLITDRDARLSSALQGTVRLARLLQLIDGRHYWAPLYRGKNGPFGLQRLTSQAFRNLLTQAVAAGRIDPAIVAVTEAGVTFLEPELCTRAGSVTQLASLSFGAMPMLGGLLTVLHEALGIHVVADRLLPLLTTGRPTAPAFEIANSLTRALDTWLTGNLDTSHYLRQARAIRSFLSARDIYDPVLIDDAVILAFWQEQVRRQIDTDLDGFRLFKSAARKLMLYRDQMRSIAAADGLSNPVDIDAVPPGRVSLAGALVPDETEGGWRSPLVDLTSVPADQIKWLTKTERQQLANFLDQSPFPDHPPDGQDSVEANRHKATGGGLALGLRYDLALWRTLLRADVFGDVQAKLTQRLRDDGQVGAAIDATINAVPASAYCDALETYRAIRAQVELAMLATLDVLATHGAPVAGLLVECLGDEAARQDMRVLIGPGVASDASPEPADEDVEIAPSSDMHGDLRSRIESALREATRTSEAGSSTSLDDLLRRAKKARKAIRRRGFGVADADDKLAGFVAAVEPLIRLLRELDRLIATLAMTGRCDTLEADRIEFLATFQLLYRSLTEPV